MPSEDGIVAITREAQTAFRGIRGDHARGKQLLGEAGWLLTEIRSPQHREFRPVILGETQNDEANRQEPDCNDRQRSSCGHGRPLYPRVAES